MATIELWHFKIFWLRNVLASQTKSRNLLTVLSLQWMNFFFSAIMHLSVQQGQCPSWSDSSRQICSIWKIELLQPRCCQAQFLWLDHADCKAQAFEVRLLLPAVHSQKSFSNSLPHFNKVRWRWPGFSFGQDFHSATVAGVLSNHKFFWVTNAVLNGHKKNPWRGV